MQYGIGNVYCRKCREADVNCLRSLKGQRKGRWRAEKSREMFPHPGKEAPATAWVPFRATEFSVSPDTGTRSSVVYVESRSWEPCPPLLTFTWGSSNPVDCLRKQRKAAGPAAETAFVTARQASSPADWFMEGHFLGLSPNQLVYSGPAKTSLPWDHIQMNFKGRKWFHSSDN